MRRALVLVLVAGCAFRRHPVPVAFAAVAASGFVGFGTGRAIEGRWSSSGWKLALADSAFVAGTAYGLPAALGCVSAHGDCDALRMTTLWLGLLGLIGSRAWQVAR